MNNGDTPAAAVIIKPAPGAIPGAIPGARGVGWTLSDAVYTGLTKREHFCLKMSIPETGDSELDDIIRKGSRQKITGMAMQGLLASNVTSPMSGFVEHSIKVADAILKELDKQENDSLLAINIIIDESDSQSPIFVEIETDSGESINIGERSIADGLTKVRISISDIVKTLKKNNKRR